uniref:NADH-ubiquinone oxidoreductase chain 6 n=1 Tax=Ishige okamurae TaxID=233772 RepID=A0A4Y5T8I3_9PHAE|nr:NADH dehydrogenase subunit 6 [Ishige okamurae]QDB64180.1 NADH dehydrogenase subunit 6a [Ishige okamurae]WBP70183.1 NADH dehydrogenase subunit 6 [Ishige okamurae]
MFSKLSQSFIFIISLSFFVFISYKVIRTTHPIFGVLNLVVLFLGSMIFLLLIGLEYLALCFAMVYVGAIAILFLFVIMLLDIKVVRKPQDFFPIRAKKLKTLLKVLTT